MLEHCYKFSRHETVLDIIKKYPKDKAESIINFNSVQVNYGNELSYYISFINWKQKITDKFDCQGNMISYQDYYKKQYNITLKDENQPLLQTNRRNRQTWEYICLVPEICSLNTISKEMREDQKLRQEVAKHKNFSPFQKLQQIDKMVEKISIGFEKDTGIQIKNNEQFPSVKGKIFSTPKLTLKDSVTLNLDINNDIFEIDKPIVNPAHLKDWVLIYPQDLLEESKIFIQNLQKAAKQLGVKVDEPFQIEMQTNDSPQEWVKNLENDIQQNGIPLFVISLVKERNQLLYQSIKQLLIEKHGVINQNVIVQSLSKNPLSVCSNILLQINAKLGRPLWYCEKVKTMNKKTIFIGIDTFTQDGKTFVGFTSSLDPQQSQYNSQVEVQKSFEKDFVRNIDKLMMNALINFQENLYKVKFLPECIVVFRGCVGDSQRFMIQQLEVKVLKNLFEQSDQIKKMNGGKPYNPEFIFTFFLQNSRQIRKSILQPSTWNFN
ncbi:Ribonuclease H-like domain [Pseudocohnilembus persalinus]|uniref:Ribonuclease H-like domain n=1 Tax=Pseudocohnilembus persalinus TaxID=266149 RepID=A0A0V0Q7H1_PSEPJ|nr:Ribonuclease H-like domain [Pseudocohnilembus persalinus]|eukprot:KRW98111.1 Ribonuclease H-like domain [Pseudocohnilembus persalinus]